MLWVLACLRAFVAGRENPVLPLPYSKTTITPSTTGKNVPTILRTTEEGQLTTSRPGPGRRNEANRPNSGPTERKNTNTNSEPPGVVGPRKQNASVTEGPELKTSVQESEPAVTSTPTIRASSGLEVTQEHTPGPAVTQHEFRNTYPISAVQETQHDTSTQNDTVSAVQETPHDISTQNELTTYSITTELLDLSTTTEPPTTKGHGSRDLTENTTDNIFSDVDLKTYSITTELLDLSTTTTESPTLAAHDPILHALKQATVARTASGLELSNSSAECSLGCAVPVAAPDTPTALEDGPTAEDGSATTAVPFADLVTGAPLSSSDPTSRRASHNDSRTPAHSLLPRLRQRTRDFRCVPGCFPSMSSFRDYSCCHRVGSRFFYYKRTCPVGQVFSPLFRSCVFKVRPVLPYLNQQNGRSRITALHDAVIRRITTQRPRPFLINLPTSLFTVKHKSYTV